MTRKRKPFKIPKEWRDLGKAPGVKPPEPPTDAEVMARAVSAATERGRTIGRLEGIAVSFEAWQKSRPTGECSVTPETRDLLLPILRAEIERLKGGKP